MVKEIRVNGFDELMKTVDNQKNNKVCVLFTGSVDESGQSWCPDCVKADPVIKECLQYAEPQTVFITCCVGNRPFWKDQNNMFRTSNKTSLKSIPTLMVWGTRQKLEEDQCASNALVRMFFEEA
ncbi:Thioredoxin domain-containing protein 17 [Lamellibrachia satsuma]|nr:Thioredoxin domain-containing protein 17 [Lamellibrachia satsuma]